jgi:hypothetical protein
MDTPNYFVFMEQQISKAAQRLVAQALGRVRITWTILAGK